MRRPIAIEITPRKLPTRWGPWQLKARRGLLHHLGSDVIIDLPSIDDAAALLRVVFGLLDRELSAHDMLDLLRALDCVLQPTFSFARLGPGERLDVRGFLKLRYPKEGTPLDLRARAKAAAANGSGTQHEAVNERAPA